jgi:hypothetical protein
MDAGWGGNPACVFTAVGSDGGFVLSAKTTRHTVLEKKTYQVRELGGAARAGEGDGSGGGGKLWPLSPWRGPTRGRAGAGRSPGPPPLPPPPARPGNAQRCAARRAAAARAAAPRRARHSPASQPRPSSPPPPGLFAGQCRQLPLNVGLAGRDEHGLDKPCPSRLAPLAGGRAVRAHCLGLGRCLNQFTAASVGLAQNVMKRVAEPLKGMRAPTYRGRPGIVPAAVTVPR